MKAGFRQGYLDGLNAEIPNSRSAFDAAEYHAGYADGTAERQKETLVMPEWMLPQQAAAVNRLYARNEDNATSREEFFGRVQNYGDYCGLAWCGMFIGIEKDGYAHT